MRTKNNPRYFIVNILVWLFSLIVMNWFRGWRSSFWRKLFRGIIKDRRKKIWKGIRYYERRKKKNI